MKVKFTKLAALLLAGAALFATGCTDYEVDIQKVDKKVDDLTSGKVATLESQVAALQATVATLESAADHKADIDKLNKTITDLEAALQAAIALKVDQSAYDAKVAEIEKRIKDIEDKDFQKQIDDLIAAMNNAVAQINQGIADAKDELEKKIAALETTLTGKIGELETRVKANEDAIKNIKEVLIPNLQSQIDKLNNEVIPAINTKIADLESGKLDKSEFDTYYKDAYDKYTKATIDLIESSIDKLTKLTAGFPDDKTIKQYIDDMANTFTAKYLELVAKAFGSLEEMNAMEGNLLARLKACEALLAGDWGGKTVKKYIDDEVADLNDKITALDEKINALTTRVETLEGKMDTVIDALKFCEVVAEDGKVSYNLQGYIDEADQALQDQIDEIWEWIEDYLIPTLNELFEDIYNQLDDLYEKAYAALQRIQSVQFVPTHDDLKITTNMAYFYQPVDDEREMAATILDQPTKITYQFLPSQYAEDVAMGVEDFITDASYYRLLLYLFYGYGSEEDIENNVPFTREELKEMGIGGILPIFNVKPVETRADGEETPIPDPQFIITGVEYDEATVAQTGEITFTVMPVNVASAQFAANGLKPVEGVYMTDNTWDINYRYEDYGLFWDADDMAGADWYNRWVSDNWVHYVYNVDELAAFETRAAFAAQLRLYAYQTSDPIEDYDWDNCDWDAWENDPDYWPDVITVGYIDYENELASPFNVLYPAITEIEILPDPYKKEEDGSIRAFTEDEIWQKLPYSSLREGGVDADGNEVVPNIGEKETQNPKGYRIFLDQAVPAVSIDGGAPMSIEAATEKGYLIPEITTTVKDYYFEDKDGEDISDAKKANFIVTPAEDDLEDAIVPPYAEVEMNPKKPASSRKMEVGDLITGVYAFTSGLGTFSAQGYVEITKPQGEVALTSNIVWTYSLDANVDHNLWVKDYAGSQAVEAVDGGEQYGRTALAVTVEPNDLEKNLGVTIDDFRHATVKDGSLKITTTDEAGDEVEVTDIEFPGEYPVKIDADGNLTVDIKGFEWDKVYTVKADYELDAAIINVVWTITTVDRNREVIKITLPEYAFELNGEDYDPQTDTYTSKPQNFLEPLFNKFVEQLIINQEEVKDYEEAADFKGDGTAGIGGKEGHLTRYVLEDGTLPEGESKYVICGDDYALFYKVTSAQLKEVLDAGDPQVRNVLTFIGQQVEITWPVTVDLPGYNFLHLNYYTFNPDREVADFITKRNFADNEGDAVKWWSQVYPSYFNDVPADGQAPSQVNRVSNRYVLADYDVAYINLAELAFNVVDENDDIMEDEDIAEANLVVKFDYTDEEQGIKPLPPVDKITGAFETYKNLWMGNTTFYYRTNEKKFIPVKGTLAILSGDTEFPLVTRFDEGGNKPAVKFPEEDLDYTTYAVVRWTPFKVPPTVADITIVLDENKIYREPLFKGMTLDDIRPNGTTYKVIENGEWVVGNVADPNAGKTPTGNGYLQGVKSYEAYHIVPEYEYDDANLPVELKKLLKLQYTADGVTFVDEKADGLIPYIVYNYTSQVQFHGVITVPVTVVLENPWQEAITFEYNVIIKGIGD